MARGAHLFRPAKSVRKINAEVSDFVSRLDRCAVEVQLYTKKRNFVDNFRALQ